MYKTPLFTAFILLTQFVFSQTLYKTIPTTKMGGERELKIQLPRNYEQNKQKKYPIILVLDGDYLFEPMAGNVDYYSYWDDMPESIVVGVNQYKSRGSDSRYDDRRFLPEKSGAQFFEFLGMELLPFLNKEYRTTNFVVVAGHDITANFINYYLLKENPIFQGYINLSPDFAPEMAGRLAESLRTSSSPKWFCLTTASDDIPALKKAVKELNIELSAIDNPNFHYSFAEIEDATHYSLVGEALPKALSHIFFSYRPIGLKEYDELIASANSPLEYLVNRYDVIKRTYGIDKKIRVNDFFAIGKVLENQEKWVELEKLGELAKKNYPGSTLGTYYVARSYEASGDPKKAMKAYQSAYGQEEIGFMTVDFMLEKAELIKRDFGY